MKINGILMKMETSLYDEVQYNLPVGSGLVFMNELLGREISIEYLGKIHCIRCGRITKTSFAQGYCYPCFMNAPETSECVLKPELCRAHEGISRDMEWSKGHCLQDHIVYLAITSGLKVGVTRVSQIPTRWIDQGAKKAIRVAQTPNRYTAGLIEVALKDYLNDKTNWRQMLACNITQEIDLLYEKYRAIEFLSSNISLFISNDDEVTEINYPVSEYPAKVTTIDLDKTNEYEGVLTGIKGQYLIFEGGKVLNIRKYGGYLVEIMY